MFNAMIETLKANPRKIVFTEGPDARILEATARLVEGGFLTPILVGNVEEVKANAASAPAANQRETTDTVYASTTINTIIKASQKYAATVIIIPPFPFQYSKNILQMQFFLGKKVARQENLLYNLFVKFWAYARILEECYHVQCND